MEKWKVLAKESGIYNDLFMRRVRDLGWSLESAATIPPRESNKYEDWLEVARENNIKESTFYSRINRLGWSPQKAATVLPKEMKERKKGKWYDLAIENGIAEDTYYYRIEKAKWSPEKAATTPVQKRPDASMVKEAKRNGIHRRTYTSRVDDAFWDPEEAATVLPMTQEEMTDELTRVNQEYAKIRQERTDNDPDNLFTLTPKLFDKAMKNGISKGTVEARVYKHGWTVQEATTVPVRKRTEKPEGFDKWIKVAMENGISEGTFGSRVKSLGWALKDAALIKPNQRKFRVHNPKYLKLAKANGVSAAAYRKRIYRGWTEEEASTISLLKSGEFKDEETKERVHAAFKKFRTGESEIY